MSSTRRLDNCYSCRNWIGFGVRERGPRGQCRRYPPVVTDRAPFGAFPVTNSADWCGEWQRHVGRSDPEDDAPPRQRQVDG
ncbi:MAG: hypothetical protein P4M00_18295 [Azospirillaceae bacterium]|nr:hypothetical protein [Azospirillaceae bacterium]